MQLNRAAPQRYLKDTRDPTPQPGPPRLSIFRRDCLRQQTLVPLHEDASLLLEHLRSASKRLRPTRWSLPSSQDAPSAATLRGVNVDGKDGRDHS